MFEKSLYDLIKGLRQHKGNEKDFIEHSLRECRREIRGADMDLKATALLKLVYLEMFGYDMSWAAFNILEVMSAPRHHQKRIGYLGAVQTFGPNTEVLMLATNLLKKDITSSTVSVISLPLVTIPHLVTSGLAAAVVPDLLARMGHSHSIIRKKAIVTLYRLALVWPEALRPAWPKMKDILQNEDEDPGVISTVVNVVCELVWRRPEDFLSLAPRFFELLVHGENNWMAIKLIKLFATLTPLEPRLVKKLAPALTNLIKTTPAKSVMYECINGIIQGGILDGVHGIREGDEIAEVCVDKLCEMIAVDGDPNLKYVALLAFNKIVTSYPLLVSQRQEIVASCLDDSDISIRMQALTLVSKMVNQDNLVIVVSKLVQQLDDNRSEESFGTETDRSGNDRSGPAESRRSPKAPSGDFHRYGLHVVRKILDMCSSNMYGNVDDFDWYIDILARLVQLVPVHSDAGGEDTLSGRSVSDSIGYELRNVAVRVKSARRHAVEVASSLLSSSSQSGLRSSSGIEAYPVLEYAAFIVGEFPGLLPSAQDTLHTLMSQLQKMTEAQAIVIFLQAVPKILCFILTFELNAWNAQRHGMAALLIARMVSAVERFGLHGDIEVQEIAVSLLEIAHLSEAALLKHPSNELVAPVLIRDVVPSLFTGADLNPVALSAQHKVPHPKGLDLDSPINDRLALILQRSEERVGGDSALPMAKSFYHEPGWNVSSIQTLEAERPSVRLSLYQEQELEKKQDRPGALNVEANPHERLLYDPFYISRDKASSDVTSNSMHAIIQDSNGHSLDVESIPIVELDLGLTGPIQQSPRDERDKSSMMTRTKLHTEVAKDENFGAVSAIPTDDLLVSSRSAKRNKTKQGLLQIDSSNLNLLYPHTEALQTQRDTDQVNAQRSSPPVDHENEMKAALAEVERLRLEMQRAQDRVALAEDIPQEGTLIAKKKKKKRKDLGIKTADKKKTKKHMSKMREGGSLAAATPMDDHQA